MDLFDEVLRLVTGIIFIIFSVYGLKNIDNIANKDSWLDERVSSYKSKKNLFKALFIVVMICGIGIVSVYALTLLNFS